jgi:photosystem II stability/assembly factor-like uncharacterized protein
VPRSFTAIGELTWWVLGDAPCSAPPCTSIVRTTDGGAHFVGIPAPRAPLANGSATPPFVSELRFADAGDGFAYGGGLYATHTGGAAWHAIHLGGSVGNVPRLSVIDLAIGGGEVYAIAVPRGGGPGRLMRSPISRDAWSLIPAAGDVFGSLWVHGADVFVQSGDNLRLLVSHDRGESFATYRSPVAGLPCDYEEMEPPVVWAHCATGMDSAVWRSVDGGRTFTLASDGALGRLPNSASFASSSATAAVVGYEQLFRSVDAGKSYQPVGPSGLWWDYLGFTDATHGVALGFPASTSTGRERLYYTTDAGRNYHLVLIR